MTSDGPLKIWVRSKLAVAAKPAIVIEDAGIEIMAWSVVIPGPARLEQRRLADHHGVHIWIDTEGPVEYA